MESERNTEGRLFHITVDPDAEPVAKRAYPVTRKQWEVFKRELDHLVELGVCHPPERANGNYPHL